MVTGMLMSALAFNAQASDKIYQFKKILGDWAPAVQTDTSGGMASEDGQAGGSDGGSAGPDSGTTVNPVQSTNAFSVYRIDQFSGVSAFDTTETEVTSGRILFEINSNLQGFPEQFKIKNKTVKDEKLSGYSIDMAGVNADFFNAYLSTDITCADDVIIKAGDFCRFNIGKEVGVYSGPSSGVIKVNYDGKVFPVQFEAYDAALQTPDLYLYDYDFFSSSGSFKKTLTYSKEEWQGNEFTLFFSNTSEKSVRMEAFTQENLKGLPLTLVESACDGYIKGKSNCHVVLMVDQDKVGYGYTQTPVSYGGATAYISNNKGLSVYLVSNLEGYTPISGVATYEKTLAPIAADSGPALLFSMEFWNNKSAPFTIPSSQSYDRSIVADPGFEVSDNCQADSQIGPYNACKIDVSFNPANAVKENSSIVIKMLGVTYILHKPVAGN